MARKTFQITKKQTQVIWNYWSLHYTFPSLLIRLSITTRGNKNALAGPFFISVLAPFINSNWFHNGRNKTKLQWGTYFSFSFLFFQELIPVCIRRWNVSSSFSRPLSGSVLVVGCDNGLFVWTVDPSSPAVRCVLCIS